MAAEAIRAGARGYVLKSAAGEELVRALAGVMGGHTYVTPTLAMDAITSAGRQQYVLTDKQLRILEYVARGLRSKQIAYELGVSVRTIESHKYAIMSEGSGLTKAPWRNRSIPRPATWGSAAWNVELPFPAAMR